MLETGGINEVNYYVLDGETGEEIHSESPRMAASSPIGYETGYRSLPQFVDLDPGRYTVVVNTDIERQRREGSRSPNGTGNVRDHTHRPVSGHFFRCAGPQSGAVPNF